jgi:hypothetical protein
MMTVGELMEILENLDPDTEVRLATQRQWPFEYTVGGVAEPLDGTTPLYLAAGKQLGYLPENVREELGWAE